MAAWAWVVTPASRVLRSFSKVPQLLTIQARLWQTTVILGRQTTELHSRQWLRVDQRHLEASPNTSPMLATLVASVRMALAAQVGTLLAAPSELARARLASHQLLVATRLLPHRSVQPAPALPQRPRVSLLQARASHQPRLHTRQHLRALVKVCRQRRRTTPRHRQAIRLRLQRLAHRPLPTIRQHPQRLARHHLRRLHRRSTVLLPRCTAQQARRTVVVEEVQASSRQLRRITRPHLPTSARRARPRLRAHHTRQRARCTTLLLPVLAV
jgi:hypothetical protein